MHAPVIRVLLSHNDPPVVDGASPFLRNRVFKQADLIPLKRSRILFYPSAFLHPSERLQMAMQITNASLMIIFTRP